MPSIQASGYFLCEPGKPLERRDFVIDNINTTEVVVQVAGCGLCHTDLSFWSGDVKTKSALPLVLGHEISGRVVAAGDSARSWLGKDVIVPAVLPCGECALCRMERDNICQSQLMPGNDFGGGFATHLKVPSRFLCEIPQKRYEYTVAELSVVADAVTTPYQSLIRSGLQRNDVAIVIGVGGIGTYMVAHAKNAGASVIALDVNETKLERVAQQGADAILVTRGLTERDIKAAVRNLIKKHHFPPHAWKVFECSGVAAGQEAAFSLLSFAGTVAIVGFSMEKIPIRLSNLMAFDAQMFGNWGCRPAYYPPVVADVLAGKIPVKQNIQCYSLDEINEVIQLAQAHKLERRAILVPGEQP